MRFSRLDVLGAICIGTIVLAIGSLVYQPRPPGYPVIDGWAVGNERPYVAAYIDAATEALATAYPGHAAVVRASLHDEGTYPREDGGQIIAGRSGGCCAVVLFELADGTRRAVGAGHPGIVAPGWTPKPMAFPDGPWTNDASPSP